MQAIDRPQEQDFVTTLASQRTRLLHHAGDALLSAPANAPKPEQFDRLSQAFMTSIELIKAAETEMEQFKRLVAESRAQRARFEALFDLAPAALVVTTTDTTIRSANRAAGALLGRAPAELLGRDLTSMIDRSQTRGFREHLSHMIAAGQASRWSFSINPAGRLPMVVTAAVNLFDDPVIEQRNLYWTLAVALSP